MLSKVRNELNDWHCFFWTEHYIKKKKTNQTLRFWKVLLFTWFIPKLPASLSMPRGFSWLNFSGFNLCSASGSTAAPHPPLPPSFEHQLRAKAAPPGGSPGGGLRWPPARWASSGRGRGGGGGGRGAARGGRSHGKRLQVRPNEAQTEGNK